MTQAKLTLIELPVEDHDLTEEGGSDGVHLSKAKRNELFGQVLQEALDMPLPAPQVERAPAQKAAKVKKSKQKWVHKQRNKAKK